MKKNTGNEAWIELRKELEDILASGHTPKEIDGSDLRCGIREREAIMFPYDTQKRVSAWLRDALRLAGDSTGDLTSQLEQVLKQHTHSPLVLAADSLTFEMLASDPVEVPILKRVPATEPGKRGRIVDTGEVELLEDHYIDICGSLSLLIEDLCTLCDVAARTTQQSLPSTKLEYWTREQAAKFLGITPNSLSQKITAERKANQEARKRQLDPIWVRRLPGQQRGFTVHVASFLQQMAPR